MQVINQTLLEKVSLQAKKNPRLRMNYNFHQSETDTIQRLLNALEPGTYIPPHRHIRPDKEEAILVLRGSLVSFTFDDSGQILSATEIAPAKGCYGAEIEPGVWHSILVLEPDTVTYEVKRGPFEPVSPENMASWAPEASDRKAVSKYMKELLEQFNARS